MSKTPVWPLGVHMKNGDHITLETIGYTVTVDNGSIQDINWTLAGDPPAVVRYITPHEVAWLEIDRNPAALEIERRMAQEADRGSWARGPQRRRTVVPVVRRPEL